MSAMHLCSGSDLTAVKNLLNHVLCAGTDQLYHFSLFRYPKIFAYSGNPIVSFTVHLTYFSLCIHHNLSDLFLS